MYHRTYCAPARQDKAAQEIVLNIVSRQGIGMMRGYLTADYREAYRSSVLLNMSSAAKMP